MKKGFRKWTCSFLLCSMLPLSAQAADHLPAAVSSPVRTVDWAGQQRDSVPNPPIITRMTPSPGEVITGGVLPFRLEVQDGEADKVVISQDERGEDVVHAGKVGNSIQEDVNVSRFDGRMLYALVYLKDWSDNDRGSALRRFYVEASKRLHSVEKVEGSILDFDEHRIVYQDALGNLRLKDRLTGEDTLVHDDGGDLPSYAAHLTPSGVLFAYQTKRTDVNERKIGVWTPQGLVSTGVTYEDSTGDSLLSLSDHYAVFPSLRENTTYRIDTLTGATVAAVTYGVTSAAAEPGGSFVYAAGSGTNHGIYRYLLDGSTETLAEAAAPYGEPVSDGDTVLFREGGSRLLMVRDGITTEVKAPDTDAAYVMQAGKDYGVAGGWAAYNKDADGVRQMFLRSPEGSEKKITGSYGGAARLHGLQPNGAAAIERGNDLFVYQPGDAAALRLSNSQGLVRQLGGTWYKGWETALMQASSVEIDDEKPAWAEDAVTATDITGSSAVLHWIPATDNVGVTRYHLYSVDLDTGEMSLVTSLDSSRHTFQVDGLQPDRYYMYFVEAEDAAGNRTPSNLAEVPTASGTEDVDPPAWPEGSGLTVTGMTYDTVTLKWPEAADNVGVTAYSLYRDGQPLGTVLHGQPTTYTVEGLAPGTTYTFEVAAEDAAGHSSAKRLALTVTTTARSVAPAVQLIHKSAYTGVGSSVDLLVQADRLKELNRFLLQLKYDPARLKLVYANLSSSFGKENVTAVLRRDIPAPGLLNLQGRLLDPGKGISSRASCRSRFSLLHSRSRNLSCADEQSGLIAGAAEAVVPVVKARLSLCTTLHSSIFYKIVT
ncbi:MULTISPECIES: fibronectin type III domain-containing protein [Paenibacillus]|uniref:fibronectin type III domain-containing protein n=1 Tax=Paenibacillus TaxID=44249 RepID=UPI0022B8A67C|nr:fibronectin type III domain-containing protein [Paenibacillus caseinilyticus]MCZ8518224.1 fibronectin type III domain-containing protein [Paenibacillus caseinilyticus]